MGLTGNITITSSLIINRDEEIAALHREATRLKETGDWDGAVAGLREAQVRMRESSTSYPIETWVRLPLFLKQAGRFEEAMLEFSRQLDEIDGRIAKEFSHQPERFWSGFAYHPRAVIYDKMRVACKRQKLPEEAGKYEVLRDEYREKGEKFRTEFDAWNRKDMAHKRVGRM